jgi:hypothetical protein
MKLQSAVYGVIASILVLASCKDASNFKISGALKNTGKINKVYLLEADSVQISIVDSVNVAADGKFAFKRSSPFPNLYKLRIGGNIFDLIAKNGDAIDFEADLNDQAHAYTVKGSESSEKIQEFNRVSSVFGEKNDKVVQEYQSKLEASGGKEDSLLAIYRPMFAKNMDDYTDAVLKFVSDNRTSLAAFYAMSSVDPITYEPQMIAYADDLRAANTFNDNPAVQRFLRQMMIVKPLSVGHKAPDFTIAGIDGKPIKLSDYKGKGLNILGISLDTGKPEWQKAIADDKLTWGHASDLQRFEGPTERLFNIQGIPANFIIDPQGVIVAKNVRGSDLDAFLNKTFNKPI